MGRARMDKKRRQSCGLSKSDVQGLVGDLEGSVKESG